jgi:predicted nucleic acid-binding protein
MWIVDSSVWIDYFDGKITRQTDLLHAALGSEAIAIGDIILCEVLQGYCRQEDFDAARQAMLQFPVYPIGGTPVAIKSAENYRALRRQGITVRKTIDCLVATFVMERGFQLLHSDRDFDPFEVHLGLQVVR